MYSRQYLQRILLVTFLAATSPAACFAHSWNQLNEEATSSMRKGNVAGAETAWRACIEQCPEATTDDPRFVISTRGLGQCLVEQGKLEEAEKLYQALIPKPEKIPPANSNLLAAAMEYAAVLQKEGKSAQSAEIDKLLAPVLERARTIDSPMPVALRFGADTGAEHDHQEHLRWESADGTCSHNPPTGPINLPQPKPREEDSDEKLPGEDRERTISHTDRWQVLAQRGNELLRQGKYPEAEKQLREAYAETRIYHRRDQDHQNVMIDLGTAFAGEGKYAETEIMFKAAFLWASRNTGDVSDETVRVWERYRDALRRLGRGNEAIVAASHYEESLFKLNHAISSGQIGSYGPITHITAPKSILQSARQRPTPLAGRSAGNLYQDSQSRRRFIPRYGYPFGWDQ